jgi:hypothetical protein
MSTSLYTYKVGSAVLVGGTVTVPMPLAAATDIIVYTRSTTGGTPGHLSYVINAGVSVVFTSSSGTDTSTLVFECKQVINVAAPTSPNASLLLPPVIK